MEQERIHSKDVFLHLLRSKGKYKYTRYNGLPLRYAGGKSLGVGHIVEHIPDSVNSGLNSIIPTVSTLISPAGI